MAAKLNYGRTLLSLRASGERVRIYRNLHTGGLSIQAKVKSKGWRVAAHVTAATLVDVQFDVNERLRQQVIRERVKTVHAYAVGVLKCDSAVVLLGHKAEEGIAVSYNPFKAAGFFNRETGEVLQGAKALNIDGGGRMRAWK
jgi:hypothetical protein